MQVMTINKHFFLRNPLTANDRKENYAQIVIIFEDMGSLIIVQVPLSGMIPQYRSAIDGGARRA